MDATALLERFDRFERRDAVSFGARREATRFVVRHVGTADAPSWVIYSRLDVANADAVIEGEIAHFRSLGRAFEWKHYDHDGPADLRERLVAAGFERGEPERLLALDVRSASSGGWTIEPDASAVRDGGVELADDVFRVADVVWPEHAAWLRTSIPSELEQAPEGTRLFVSYQDGLPMAASWTRRTPSSPFLGLFGGATLPEGRGRGHYRALVAARARYAHTVGADVLFVEAGPESAPILMRLGFVHLAVTTPFTWRPEGGDR